MDVKQVLTNKYIELYKEQPLEIEPITQAGSDRTYFRFYSRNSSVIGVFSSNISETQTFIYYSRLFEKLMLNTPKIFYVSSDYQTYFQEDLGKKSLLDIVNEEIKEYGYFTERLVGLYEQSLLQLVEMQIKAGQEVDFSKAYSISTFDQESILLDLNYFKYYFLNRLNIKYDEKLLQDDFEALASYLGGTGIKNFMFRDFQARNIQVKDEKVYFIDYQGARKGAMQYDLASLLWQAKAKIPQNVKSRLIDFYCSEVEKHIPINVADFKAEFWYYLYIRILQTLGAYGNRGLIERKRHFIESIPFAIDNLQELMNERRILEKYSELHRVLTEIPLHKEKFTYKTYSEFTIQVMSFGFKYGLPSDSTENGGGFIFDCRGNHNPGRYVEYKQLTGRDKPVIDFFKQHSEIDIFIDNIKKVISPTIETYIERGFTSLMICFGCTGGQHRSVYCAEAIAKYISRNYRVKVILTHREQNIVEEM